jgi:hypothetical protein
MSYWQLTLNCFSQSQSHIATDGWSVTKSWCQAPDQIFITVWQLVLFLWDALSQERTGLSFVYAAGPCQHNLSRVQVPSYSRPYFSVSDLRLPFSSPPMTRRVTVEVFDPPPHRLTASVKVKVKVTLRLTVNQSVSLGVEPHLGLTTRYLAITIWQLRSCSLHGTTVLRSCSGTAMLLLKHAQVKLSLIVTDVQIVLSLKYIHFELYTYL